MDLLVLLQNTSKKVNMTKLGYIEVYKHPLAIALRNNVDVIYQDWLALKEFSNKKANNILGITRDQSNSGGKILYHGKITSAYTNLVWDTCSGPERKQVWGETRESREMANIGFIHAWLKTPNLARILSPYGGSVGTTGWNYMEPNCNLNKHYGMVSKYIRFHLGIVCDPEAKFFVNDYEPRAWERGKVWAFDDGDAHHGTQHNGTTPRLILLVDIHKSAFTNLREEEQWG